MNLDAARLEELADSLVDSHDQLLENLVAMRKKHRLTQDAVAERMGVSQPTVAAFERYDANPTLSTIRRYALAVGASIEHDVADRCCARDDATFSAIAEQSGLAWKALRPLEFEWASGPVVVKTYV